METVYKNKKVHKSFVTDIAHHLRRNMYNTNEQNKMKEKCEIVE